LKIKQKRKKMNDILKKAYRNKKALTFFSTRDSKKKYQIAQNFIFKQNGREVKNIKNKKKIYQIATYLCNKSKSNQNTNNKDEFESYPANYNLEKIENIFQGKSFTKDFKKVFVRKKKILFFIFHFFIFYFLFFSLGKRNKKLGGIF